MLRLLLISWLATATTIVRLASTRRGEAKKRKAGG